MLTCSSIVLRKAWLAQSVLCGLTLARQGIKTAFEEVVFKILDTPSLLQSSSPVFIACDSCGHLFVRDVWQSSFLWCTMLSSCVRLCPYMVEAEHVASGFSQCSCNSFPK